MYCLNSYHIPYKINSLGPTNAFVSRTENCLTKSIQSGKSFQVHSTSGSVLRTECSVCGGPLLVSMDNSESPIEHSSALLLAMPPALFLTLLVMLSKTAPFLPFTSARSFL